MRATALATLVLLSACQNIQQLTPAGRFDLAVEAATQALEEMDVQAARVVAANDAGKLSASEAVRRFNEIDEAHSALSAAVTLARSRFAEGVAPDDLTGTLTTATKAAREILAREALK